MDPLRKSGRRSISPEDGAALLFKLDERFGHGAIPFIEYAEVVLAYNYARTLAPKKGTAQVLTCMSRARVPGCAGVASLTGGRKNS